MSRKDMLQALLAGRDRELPAGNSGGEGEPPPAARIPPPETSVRAGAVGAMGRALGRIADVAQEARAMIAAGDTVVSLDPASVEASFIVDRIGIADEDHRTLLESMREHGQQVPILVRPHPDKPGHYQAAYGHRRLRAAAELKRPIKAVVRELSDAELLVAQGQENSARLDLSYIERALFAVAIEDRGFDRAAIMAALSTEKTQLSRLLAIGRAIPVEIIRLIGPAPKTGRPRWAALAQRLETRSYSYLLERLAAAPDFIAADSDTRFARFFAGLEGAAEGTAAFQPWQNAEGREVARYKQAEGKLTLVLDDKAAPDFGTYLISWLEDLYERYREEKAAEKRR